MSTKPHFSLLATSFAGGPRPRNAALILSGLWLALFFAALFSPPVLDDADATHANAARAIATTGHFVTLRVDGVRYLEKAPLPYWLTAISFRLFGFNTFATHLPQAIAVLLLMLLGHRWANQAFGARTGFYTAIAILTSTGVFLFTRILIPEVLLSLLLATALFAFLKTLTPVLSDVPPDNHVNGMNGSEVRERPAFIPYAGPLFYPYVMWATLAFAVLAKGLVALIFFLATTLLYLTLVGEFRASLRKLRPITGGLIFLAIATPWHVLAAMHNPETSTHHGFLWFYFWNEHVLRFLGRRIPADFNKMPGWLYWTSHIIWLFPWSLFLPLGVTALWHRYKHQIEVLTATVRQFTRGFQFFWTFVLLFVVLTLSGWFDLDFASDIVLSLLIFAVAEIARRRRRSGLPPSPFHRIDPQQRSILLLSLFAAIVLLFFSLSTNQEYYTFPAYLPILLLIAATITRAEQTYASSREARKLIALAHGLFIGLGWAIAVTLLYGLWSSRHLPFNPDIGTLLAHRGVGNYTLALSSLFDLTTQSFAALRFPAILAALAFAFGPSIAWALRMQRRHIAATTAIAFTAGIFLIAAHIAFARFGPMLSSQQIAANIQQLRTTNRISPDTLVMLYGDQSYGSSIPFYLGERVVLVDGRSSSMLFGSTFPDAASIFLSPADLLRDWGSGERKLLFVPAEKRDEVDRLLGKRQIVIQEMSGKALVTDRSLAP